MKFKTLCLAIVMSVSLVTQSFAFSDILGTEWYASYVQSLNNRNIINGYEDGTFRAENSITNGEVLKIAISSMGEEPFETKEHEHWAIGYLDRALILGINIDPTIDLDENATRYFVAEMMIEILKVNTINIVSPFVDIDSDIVNTLYELGIVTGSIDQGSRFFYPDDEITRAEVSALVVRTMEIYDKHIAYREYEHPQTEYVEVPTTVEEYKNALLQLVINDVSERVVYYDDINFYDMRDEYKYHENAALAFYEVFDEYPEYFTFANQLSAPMGGTVSNSDLTLTLSSSYFDNATISTMKEDFFDEVADIWHVLRLNGSIVEQMNERQKAEVIFEWVVVNNSYDLNYQPVSYTAYGITENNTAVCQGYVALFNSLCKMEGIEVWGISGVANGGEHIWSVAVLEGEECFVDPTFADPVPNKVGFCDFSFFDVSEMQLRTTHDF
ncbi:MAG: S-layer homology domain-containing protein [Clostridia bacterium]